MKKSALDIIEEIMHEVEETNLGKDIMLEEVQMMGFKIRQLTGDVNAIAKMDNTMIESLWRIGKIDQIINASFDDLEEEEQVRLLEYLKSVEMNTEENIESALQMKKTKKSSKMLKLEVFRSIDKPSIH